MLVLVQVETQASLRDAETITHVHRGLKPAAKFKPSLRDEENAPFAPRSG